jgi:hypothetical protein
MMPDETTSYLPAPKQYVLAKMSEMEVAEMIESFIDYYDPKTGRSVHLPSPFVRHYMKRDDGVLDTVVTIAQLPIILADGGVLALEDNDVDRERGILFCIPPELLACLPSRAQCNPNAVAAAIRFLLEDWLCDVQTTFTGKCTSLAAALSIIERSLLDNRPCFFVTAGRRGTGKTTLLHMLVMAVLGIHAPAAAWSTNEEERRKALFSYLMAGVPFIIWDNIARGAQISCPHVEKACTSAYYTDRKLGVSETVAAAASAIQLFTGNNIGAKGDLASRALRITLEADRADPENRPVRHSDPIGWTEAHRGQIIRALYTILLGNPLLDRPLSAAGKTRFTVWWRMVGSALEHAAALYTQAERDAGRTDTGGGLDFKTLFLTQEEDDEEGAALGAVLAALAGKWPDNTKFAAKDVAKLVNEFQSQWAGEIDQERGATLREFLFPDTAPAMTVTNEAVTKRLKPHLVSPVMFNNQTFTLKDELDTHAKSLRFRVEVT